MRECLLAPVLRSRRERSVEDYFRFAASLTARPRSTTAAA